MTVREIFEKVRSGKIKLEYAGHCVPDTKERILEEFDKMVADSNGASDGKWSEREDASVKQVNARMRKHFKEKLDFEVDQEESLGHTWERAECRGCGERLHWVLTGKKLQLRYHWVDIPGEKFGGDFFNHPVDYVCPFATPQVMTGEIKVASPLIFANIYRQFPDSPEDKEFTAPWSLSNTQGRKNITAHKASQNVAYGQMSNMSVGIFVSPDKRSIIVGDPYVEDHRCEGMTDDEYKKRDKKALSMIEGHKMVGKISLAVWRWEATDLKTLGEKAYDKLKKAPYEDVVKVTVPHGIWKFEHYFNQEAEDIGNYEMVYARLTLKEMS